MVDENSTFGGFLTDIGEAKQSNANALKIPWKLTHMLLGDANGSDPVPDPEQTELIHQVYRAAINQLSIDPDNPAILIAELVLPPNVGGWWIRELGLEDEDGDFVAVANCAPSYKPLLAQGSGRNQVVRMHLILSNTANVELKVDPSVVLATRALVDDEIDAHAQSRNHPDATTSEKGFMQFGTSEETRQGTRTDRAAHLAGVKAALNSRAASQSEMAAGESETQFIAVKRLIEQLATGEEAQALSSMTKLLTPGTLNEAFRGENQGNDFQVLPGGKILQCGNVQAADGDQIGFPVEFPTSARSITLGDLTGVSGEINNQAAASLNRSGFTFRTSSGEAESFSYIVFGD